jgi:prevent-host-death family protein
MRIISLSECKAKLSKYATACKKEPVVVTVNGVPSFQLTPINEGDDLIDRLIADHPGFRKILEARLKGKFISAGQALRRMNTQ